MGILLTCPIGLLCTATAVKIVKIALGFAWLTMALLA